MSSIRKYTPEENFRRIKRQKLLSFVVVEGSDDVPIYDSFLSIALADADFDVIHSGGKGPIRDFLREFETNNSIFIVDKDFNDMGIEDDRLVGLSRYSIENYFICEDVISRSLQFVLKCRFQDAKQAFSLEDFSREVANSTETLIKVLFYYQRYMTNHRREDVTETWSDAFLCEQNNWTLCREKIEELIANLLPADVTEQDVEEFYEANFESTGDLTHDFPGKLLKHSLQRYIRQKLLEINPTLGGKFNNVEIMVEALAAVIYQSDDLATVLQPVVQFVYERNVA
ncbi:DUF4435 domain-containing protein [Paraglaciecola sp.]|uniref:DUF4435 domain-containing protein n=1 Tax=Paraglaciecola sp. TaxID=1920173 RepID=UPI003EF4AD6E